MLTARIKIAELTGRLTEHANALHASTTGFVRVDEVTAFASASAAQGIQG